MKGIYHEERVKQASKQPTLLTKIQQRRQFLFLYFADSVNTIEFSSRLVTAA
jgi:hypothetical protein